MQPAIACRGCVSWCGPGCGVALDLMVKKALVARQVRGVLPSDSSRAPSTCQPGKSALPVIAGCQANVLRLRASLLVEVKPLPCQASPDLVRLVLTVTQDPREKCMAITEDTATTHCSFCLKPSNEVAKLVAGPGVYICNECLDLSSQIISNPPSLPSGLTSWEEGLDLEGVLASLPRMAAAGAQAERNLTRFVKRARELGATWAAIGASLGMTRQSAWERFSGEE